MGIEDGWKLSVAFVNDAKSLVFYEGTEIISDEISLLFIRKDGVQYRVYRSNILYTRLSKHEQEREENPWE
jgi:hypothetical protein